ncbi:583_t:CDS:2, partial [Cetraspora pellucida]
VKRYEKEQEFRMCYYHVEKSKNSDIRRCTLVCEHFGQPEITKSKDPKKETTSKHIGFDEHKNHDLDLLHYNFQENIEFTTEMIQNVEFYVKTMNCSPQQVCKALEEKYFIKIYMPVLHRVIQQFRPKLHDQKNDVSKLYEKLLNKKEADPWWYVQVDWNPNSKCLRRLFYMSPDQIERWLEYCDVVLNNNTSATNHYEIALSLFLVVDNHLSSRLVAQALTDDETKETHSWILQQIKKATHDAIPQVIFTDADPALVAAIRDEFPTTNALYCMFHIAQNIAFNLKNHLKDQYDKFVKNFFKVQQIGFRLYNNKESWAKAFVLKLFTAGMLSTSQVESYNSKIKRLIFNSNTTILELVDKLTACILEEDKKTDYALFCASIPKAALVATTSTILPNIQEDQIKQSLQYHAVIVTQSELQRYHAINFNDPAIFENQNYTDIIAKAMLNL